MHCGSEFVANTDNNIAEYCLSALAVDLNADYLFIFNAVFSSGLGCQMDMSLCNDNALGYFNFAAGTYDFAAGSSRKVTGFSYRYGNTYASCVGCGKFNLGLLSYGTENGDVCNLSLRPHNGYSFVGSILSGLGKFLFNGKFKSLSEKNIKVFTGNVNVACGSFNEYLIHFKTTSFHVII